MVETVGEAWQHGWRAQTRCLHKAVRTEARCSFRLELDMDTLLVSKGPSFRLDQLSGRLICPRCRHRRTAVTFLPPAEADSAGVRRPTRMRRISAFPDEPLDQVFRYKLQDRWGGKPTTLVLADTHAIAEAAFRGACAEMPGRPLVLLEGGRELMHQELDPAAMETNTRRRANPTPR
jgi:hypothetical protein